MNFFLSRGIQQNRGTMALWAWQMFFVVTSQAPSCSRSGSQLHAVIGLPKKEQSLRKTVLELKLTRMPSLRKMLPLLFSQKATRTERGGFFFTRHLSFPSKIQRVAHILRRASQIPKKNKYCVSLLIPEVSENSLAQTPQLDFWPIKQTPGE